jgi:hypothetical protein
MDIARRGIGRTVNNIAVGYTGWQKIFRFGVPRTSFNAFGLRITEILK